MASVPNPGERRALVEGNMVGLGALYLILRNVRARMMGIALVVDVMGVHPDDRVTHFSVRQRSRIAKFFD